MSVILKASTRGKGAQFARYLLDNSKNEQTRVFDIRGTASPENARDSLLEMAAYERLTRSTRPFLQVVMNFDDSHRATDKEWAALIRRTEKQLALDGHQFVGVMHTYQGKEHMHAVWGRFDPVTETMKNVDHIGLDLKAVSLEHALEHKHEHLLKWQKDSVEKLINKNIDNKKVADEIKNKFFENNQDIVEDKNKTIYDIAREELRRKKDRDLER